MISNAEKPEIKSEGRWHYLALKLSALSRGTTSKKYLGHFLCELSSFL